MRLDRSTVLACVVCVVLWSWATGTGRDDSPTPRPRPLDDRPVLRWVSRTAKALLWFSLIAEKPPTAPAFVATVQTGPDGQPMLDHGRGW